MSGIFVIVLAVIVAIPFVIKVIDQYERAVILRLGKVQAAKGPGIRIVIPVIDRLIKVGMRVVTLPVQSQNIITKDNVSVDAAAVAYYHVIDPVKSVVEIENVQSAIYQIAQTTVRNVVGQSTLDEVLSQTAKINETIKTILDKTGEQWGVFVDTVELKDIKLPDSMQRAMAKEAEAEREKRAKIIAAEGEQLSATKLGEAADIINDHPIALQLRNLQVLSEIAVEKNSTIIFPAQLMDSVSDVKNFMKKEGK